MAPKIHPLSLLVFLIGVLLAATGITLSIVFGVTNSGTPAVTQAPLSCDARLFTIRTGLASETNITWSENLGNPNSKEFKDAADKVNLLLSTALNAQQSSSASAYISNAAATTSPTSYVVQVTRFMQSADGQSVVAFAAGAATGDTTTVAQLPDNLEDNVQTSLQQDKNITLDPTVNYDAMTFCNGDPNNNLNGYTGTPPPPDCNCPTSPPCPTEMPQTCPTPETVPCHNVTLPCDCSTCPSATCPTPEVCPKVTCPTPQPCPEVGSTCPTPVCDATTCAPFTQPCEVCPTGTTQKCPEPTSTCPTPVCDVITCAPFATTCPPQEPCSTGGPDATTCAPFTQTCPTCPSCAVCPTGTTLFPPTGPTCPPPQVCPTCPTVTPGGTCPPCGSQEPTTCPTCPACPSLGTTISSTGTTTPPVTVTQGTVTQGASTLSTLQGSTTTVTLETGTSGSPTSTVTQTAGSTTEAMTTEAGTTTTAKPICYGEEFYYGNLAFVFEHSDAGSQAAQNDQNIMINTFMSLQLLKFPGYLIDSSTTRLLISVYPDPSQYIWLENSYSQGIRDLTSFNSTLIAVDLINPPDSPDARINDGLQFVLNAKDQDRVSGVIIVGISSAFVNDAVASAQTLKEKGSFVFTVSLNGTGDLGPLASDPAYAFQLKNPRNAGDASKIATAIGNTLVAQSSICIGGTSPTTKPPPTTTVPPTSVVMTTTTPPCPMKFITNDIAFVFENSFDTQGTFVQSDMTASFLINYLVAKAMSDLNGSGTWSALSNLSLVGFPDPQLYSQQWPSCCDFGKVDQPSYKAQINTMNIAAKGFPEYANSTATSLNDGLNYANQEYIALNDNRKLSIVLFANSAIGVDSATATATALRQNGNAVVTVAVGGIFDLSPLAITPSTVHYLNSNSNQANLAQAIVNDLANQGTRCCNSATQCL